MAVEARKLRLTIEPSVDGPGPAAATVAAWRDDRGAILARAVAEGPDRWIEWPGVGIFVFSTRSRQVRARPAPGVGRQRVCDLFARVLQPVILQALGEQALHASAVVGAGGVLAFCGRGRSGKSTLAFALGQQGFRQIADDAVVIEAVAPIVSVRPLPFTPQLREASRRHFADQPAIHRGDNSHIPEAIVAEPARLRAIFLLEQDAGLSRCAPPERLPAVQAFAALLRHAHCFHESDRTHSARLVEDYLEVVARVVVFTLRYPPRFEGLPALVWTVVRLAGQMGVTALEPVREVSLQP